MANFRSAGEGNGDEVNAEDEQTERLIDQYLSCLRCQAQLPVIEVGDGWCWHCGVRYWVEMKVGGLQIYAVEMKVAMGVETMGDVAMAACQLIDLLESGNRDEVDPEGGIHGACPLCGEWLAVYISGRCRCEACGCALVVRHRPGSGGYAWLADEQRFEWVSGRVRTAWRDDLTEI